MQFNSPKVSIYLIVIFVVFAASLFKIADLDFWWHLKTGQVVLEEKEFQRTEIYSFTANGREYIDHEWLFQVVMYLFYSKFGPAGAIVLKCVIFSLIYFLTTRHLLQQNASPYLILAIQFLSICGGLPRMIERPEMFTALFFLISFLILDYSLRNNKRAVLIFLPLTIRNMVQFSRGSYTGNSLIGCIHNRITSAVSPQARRISNLLQYFCKRSWSSVYSVDCLHACIRTEPVWLSCSYSSFRTHVYHQFRDSQ